MSGARDYIQEWNDKAWCAEAQSASCCSCIPNIESLVTDAFSEIERLRAEVATEREECAKIADCEYGRDGAAARIAAAIRARGTP